MTYSPCLIIRASLHKDLTEPLLICVIYCILGRAIAQAVSDRISTAAARVRARVRSCGIYGGQCGTVVDFLQVFL
jgi:hypothetical protein